MFTTVSAVNPQKEEHSDQGISDSQTLFAFSYQLKAFSCQVFLTEGLHCS